MDLKLISDAPFKFLRAASLDLISNISATNDWRYSSEVGDEDGPDGDLLVPGADSPEPESPAKKKGTKVKKKKSFKDALVKKFSKKGERPAKYEKGDAEKVE